jgi:sugar phosphate isomerase/epimerase
MTDGVFAHLPFERLLGDGETLAELNVAPELYLRQEVLLEIQAGGLREEQLRAGRWARKTLHAPFFDLFPGSGDREIRQLSWNRLDRVMDLGARWGAELIVMHPNYDPVYYRHQVDEWILRAAEFFGSLAEKEPGRPPIAIENIAEETPQLARRLVERIASPRVFHCFDFGHHHVFSPLPFEQWLQGLGKPGRLHFHLHDNHGDDDHHLPLGAGTISWARARQMLEGLPVPHTLTLEAHSQAHLRQTVAAYQRLFGGSPSPSSPGPAPA